MRRAIIVVIVFVILFGVATPTRADGIPDFKAQIDTEDVMRHVRALSVEIGARVAGSEAETEAAAYIAAAFEGWGYGVEIAAFDVDPSEEDAEEEPFVSRNVIATRAGDELMIVVGAHMDSVNAATGAGDNASGVAAMLAAAEALADVETTHTLVFVAFGAEEIGLVGSSAYVESLGDDIENVIAMINLDSVGVGTNLNVYAGAVVTWPENETDPPLFEGGPVWVRDTALDLAAEMNLPFGTTPDSTWGGFTGDWSDHYPFVEAGVPVAYFEAWLWDGGDDPWWGIETEEEPEIMHTERDTIEAVVPEKVEHTAELLAATVYVIATGRVTPES